MAQQVEFPEIPNTEPQDYQSVIGSLLGFIQRESPTDKELRKHMRARSIFDKVSAPQLFELLGIVVEKGAATRLAEFGQTLLDIDDDVKWKVTLFRELGRRNPILLKYVFDALEERLYSINEMYRVLTSYVYPGDTVTLVSFKAWMKWIEATGMIKYIGIRWGHSPLVKEVESWLRTVDIEEVLEEEAEEAYDDEDGDAEGEGAGAPETTDEESAAPLPLEPEPDELDLPPEPPTPPGTAVESVGGPASTPPQAVVPSPSMTPIPTQSVALTLRAVAEIREVQKVLDLDPGGAELAQRSASLDDAEIAQNLEGLRGLWQTAPDKRLWGFETVGIDPGEYKPRGRKSGVNTFFLYRALVAATCLFRPARVTGGDHSPARDGRDRFAALEASGALSRHFQEEQPVDHVVTALVAAGYGNRLDILALTPYLVLARQALHGADDWVKEVQKAGSADELWEAVYARLNAGVFTLELIWLVREMARHELWTVEGLDKAQVVPTQEVLDIAFRIGLLPTPYTADLHSALFASKTLTGFCGVEHGLEAGLLHFGRHLGCAYDCPHRAVCAYFCREKLRR